ncbi:MAG TPA: DUF835 domain-containing protein [Thermoplasmata archaeon]
MRLHSRRHREALLFAALLIASTLVLSPAEAGTYGVTEEQVIVGTTSGPSATGAADGQSETLTESLTTTQVPSTPVSQTLLLAEPVSGTFPAGIASLDGSEILYTEVGTGTPATNTVTRNPATVGTCTFQWGNLGIQPDTYTATGNGGDACVYLDYGLSVPAGSTIASIELGYMAYSNNGQFYLSLSWNDGGSWCPSVSSGPLPKTDPPSYTFTNFTACRAWSYSDANRVAARFTATAGGSVQLDANAIRVVYTYSSSYELDVRYLWTSVPAGAPQTLTLAGRILGDNISVEVLTPPAAWNARGTVNGTSRQTLAYDLTPAEYNSGSPAVRFVDAAGSSPSPTSLWLDYAAVVTTVTGYRLAVVQNLTGISGGSPVLEIRGAISAGPENANVEVWNFTSASWDVRLGAPFGASDAYHNATLFPDERSGGTVRVRYVDAGADDAVQATLRLDLVAVSTVPDGGAPWALAWGLGLLLAIVAGGFAFAFWIRGRRGRDEPAPPKGPRAPLEIRPGHAYLVEEPHPEASLHLLQDLDGGTRPILAISRVDLRFDGAAREASTIRSYRLVDRGSLRGDGLLTPSLERTVLLIEEFLGAEARGAVFLEGLEFLSDNNNFGSVLRLVRLLVDRVARTDHMLLVSVAPGIIPVEDLRRLKKEMEVVMPLP